MITPPASDIAFIEGSHSYFFRNKRRNEELRMQSLLVGPSYYHEDRFDKE